MWFEPEALKNGEILIQPVGILTAAAGLDFLIGDPWGWPHPVQLMGWCISTYSRAVTKAAWPSWLERVAGVGLGLGLIIGSGAAGWALLWLTQALHPALAWATGLVLLASCFAGRSLRRAAEDVLVSVEQGNLALARQKLALYVGRDTANLSEAEILRAVMETVSENATDGVMAPLFYAVIGAFLGEFLPGIGSVPLALAYKAASTLDSMVGYKEPPYTYLGWFSARLEDALTWLPCRLVVFTIALLSGQPRRVWQVCQRDAIADPSPNAGWSECAYAAALGVQLGGVNRYRGVVKAKPLLGDALAPITPQKIRQALQLTQYMFLVWLCLAVAGLTGLNLVH
ncbi:MAG TPA: adenosylcobinamide-phosphate synthase CbiB [Trichocoleus sp.]